MSEFERNNRIGIICHTVVVSLMELLAFLSYGFAVYFTLVIFTSADAMLFYFVVPLLLVISIYNDVAYSLKINIGVVIESLLITILGGVYGKFGFTTFNNALIQDIVIILIAVFSYHVAKTININNQIKLDKIRDMMDSTDRGILSINDDLTTLLESADSTKSAMDQVSEGVNNTAEAVQSQLLAELQDNMSASLEYVTRGIHTISEEINAEKSQLSFAEIEKNADYVNENMSTLVESLQDLTWANHDIMDSIETISAVSEQVSALATEARDQEFQNTKVLNHIADAAQQLTK